MGSSLPNLCCCRWFMQPPQKSNTLQRVNACISLIQEPHRAQGGGLGPHRPQRSTALVPHMSTRAHASAARAPARARTHTHAHARTHTRTHMYACAHTHTHKHAHVQTRTHTHTQVRGGPWVQQAEQLQPAHGHGVARHHAREQGFGQPARGAVRPHFVRCVLYN